MRPIVQTFIRLYEKNKININAFKRAIKINLITAEDLKEGLMELLIDKKMDVKTVSEILIGCGIISSIDELVVSTDENAQEDAPNPEA